MIPKGPRFFNTLAKFFPARRGGSREPGGTPKGTAGLLSKLFRHAAAVQGHTMKPWPHRQPPQVGAVFPKQSSRFSSESRQPPQS